MKTKEEIIQKFEEFNREAKPLFEMSFQEKLKGSGVKLSWSREDKKLRTEFRGPDDESIKAYCNDLRKFIQKNDSLKIEKLVPFYQSNLVSQKNKRFFGQQMSEIDKFLKSSTKHTLNGKTYTNQEILEIFLYGKISHRTEGKKEIHDSLEKSPLYLSLKNIFVIILHRYLVLINNLVFINKEVLSDFNKKQNKIEWKEVKIGEVCEVKRGNSITKKDITDGDIPVIAGGQHPAYYHNLSNRSGETLTVSGSGAYAGFVAYFNIPIFASDCSTIQSNLKEVSMKYIYYLLKGIQNKIYSLQKGIAQPHVYPKDLSKIKISIPFSNGSPDLKEQERIVKILEDSLELNKKGEKIEKLFDEYLQTFFYEMFLKEKGKFKEVSLGEVFEIARGGSPRPIQNYITKEKNGINWIRISDTKNDTKYIYQTEEKIKPEGLKKTRLVQEGDFLLSNSMSFGRPYIMRTKGCIHDGWLVIRDINKVTNNDYLYSILSSDYLYSQFLSSVAGTTVKNLKIEVVKKVKIPLPPFPLQQKFATIVEQIEKMKDKINQTKQNSEELFNSLVNKGFRGEL